MAKLLNIDRAYFGARYRAAVQHYFKGNLTPVHDKRAISHIFYYQCQKYFRDLNCSPRDQSGLFMTNRNTFQLVLVQSAILISTEKEEDLRIQRFYDSSPLHSTSKSATSQHTFWGSYMENTYHYYTNRSSLDRHLPFLLACNSEKNLLTSKLTASQVNCDHFKQMPVTTLR